MLHGIASNIAGTRSAWWSVDPGSSTRGRRLDPALRAMDAGGSATAMRSTAKRSFASTRLAPGCFCAPSGALEHHGLTGDPRTVNVRPRVRCPGARHRCWSTGPPSGNAAAAARSSTRLYERIVCGLCHALSQGYGLVGLLAWSWRWTVATVVQPRRLRGAALVHQMEETEA